MEWAKTGNRSVQAQLEIGCQRQPTGTRGILSLTGQAVTEMAIFGSLVIMVFGIWLSYAQTFTEQQTIQQQAFRMALRRAYRANDTQGGFISYNIIKNHRTPNLSGGLNQGNRESVSAGSTVLWAVSNPESYSYYQINNDLIGSETDGDGYTMLKRVEKDVEGEDVDTPVEVWNTETETVNDYASTSLKREDKDKIRTARSSSNTDRVTTTLKTRYQTEEGGAYSNGDDVTVSQRLDEDGRYSQEAQQNNVIVERSRTWETSH